MKKILIVFWVLIVLFGLAGCELSWLSPKPDPKPVPDPEPVDTGLTQQELWDYLDNYNCFTTVEGVRDPVFIFENEDDFTVDFSFEGFSEENFYFTELISFNYEGNNLYKVEYENPYEWAFESSVFYFEFDPQRYNTVIYGCYREGEIYNRQLFGDEALTIDEILKILNLYEYWLEEEGIIGHSFITLEDDNMFCHGLMNSSFYRNGTISKAEFKGLTTYEITIDYPARETSEMDDGYEAYCKTHKLVISPYVRFIGFETDVAPYNFKWFYPEIEFTLYELYQKISDKIFESDDTGLEYHFYIDDNKYYIKISDPDTVSLTAIYEIKSIKFQGKGTHTYIATIADSNNLEIWISYNYIDWRHMSITIYENDNLIFFDKATASYINY